MRILLTLLWRLLTRMVRRLGLGAMLAPVAMLGMVVFGVTLWTIAAVVLAVVVTVRRPTAAAALLPVTMVCLGICGLAVAAATPGAVTANWAVPAFGIGVQMK